MAILPTNEKIREFGIDLMSKVRKKIIDETSKGRGYCDTVRRKEDGTSCLKIDQIAEELFCEMIQIWGKNQGLNIKPIGEETINEDPNYQDYDGIVVLGDLVDGTDLLVRGLSNWCSACTFYYPPIPKILAAFVADSNGEVYFALDNSTSQKFDPRDNSRRKLNGPSRVTKLEEATICFYGQKLSNLKSIFNTQLVQEVAKFPNVRIYNLAGNPLMVRLVDNPSPNEKKGWYDIIFDTEGQPLHDVAPGAYIAIKSDAIMCDLEGRIIDEGYLASTLLRPASEKIRYVLSATPELNEQFRALLREAKR